MVRIGTACIALAATATVACDGEPRPGAARGQASEAEPTAADAYRAIEVEDPGSIAGAVRWSGPAPRVPLLAMRMHRAACGPTQPSPALRVSARGGVADAVVSLLHVGEGIPLARPDAPAVITRAACRFEPHVAAVAVGAPLRFRNGDAVLHNLHARRGRATVWDRGLPQRGSSVDVQASEPGVLELVCDAGHTWEHGWLHVFAHPYFAVTDGEGRFRIGGIPPGQYVVSVWHEGWLLEAGTEAGRPRYSRPVIMTRTISVSPRQETATDFELGDEAARAAGR